MEKKNKLTPNSLSHEKTRILQLIFVLIVAAWSCSKNAKNFNSDFSLFKEYILNFSSGLVSANSDIRVVLAFNKKKNGLKTRS